MLEATYTSILKINLGYIVDIFTQDHENLLQSHWNTKTKDYLQDFVTALIF